MPAAKVRFANPKRVEQLIKQKLSETKKPLTPEDMPRFTQDEMAQCVGLEDPGILLKRLRGEAGRRSWFEACLGRLGIPFEKQKPWLVEVQAISPPLCFLGRKQEHAELMKWLQDKERRLITIVGIGGMGKTLLARKVASSVGAVFSGGVFWEPLESIQTYNEALRSLILSLGGESEEYPVLGMLATRLKSTERVLLVLDNLEQLLDDSNEGNRLRGGLKQLLEQCHNLSILTTSRQKLSVVGEYVYSLEQLSPEDALEFFHHHFRASGGMLDSENAQDRAVVEKICTRLAGWPAVLSVAASQGGLATPEELLECLPTLPPSGFWDGAERFHSVEGLLTDCCKFLTDTERAGFFALSVFEGSFDQEGARSVAGVERSLLQVLILRSLVSQQRDPLQRTSLYRLLEPIRPFARHQLGTGTPLQQELGHRHASWCLELGERALHELKRTGSAAADRALLDSEADRQAALARATGATRAGLLWVQGRVLARHGKLSEARELLERAADCAEAERRVRFEALTELSYVAREQGDLKTATERLAQVEAEKLAETPREQLDVLALKAHLAIVKREFERAYTLLQEGVRLAQEQGEARELAMRYAELGWLAQETGEALWCTKVLGDVEQGVVLYQKLGDTRGYANSTNTLGALFFLLEQYPEAEKHYQAALDLLPTNANLLVRGRVLFNLGEVASKTERIEMAKGLLEQAQGCFEQCEAWEYAKRVNTFLTDLTEGTVQ